MEVFTQRLEQEHGALSVLTAPAVTYKAILKPSKNLKNKPLEIYFNNPAEFPDKQAYEALFEPMVLGTIIGPSLYTTYSI